MLQAVEALLVVTCGEAHLVVFLFPLIKSLTIKK